MKRHSNAENNEDIIVTQKKRSSEDSKVMHSAHGTTTHDANCTPTPMEDVQGSNTNQDKLLQHFFIARAWLPGLSGVMNIISWNCRGLGHVKAVPCRYSVKEDYRVLMSEKWSQGVGRKNWNSLWTPNAPPKARRMLWRICHGCTATRGQLLSQHVGCIPICPLCNEDDENDYHAFFTCPYAVSSWVAAGLNNIIMPKLNNFNNAAELIFDICRQEDKNVAGRVATVCYGIFGRIGMRKYGTIPSCRRSRQGINHIRFGSSGLMQNRCSLATNRVGRHIISQHGRSRMKGGSNVM
ncbi:polynucleotidyl transferase, ribonuclease H fold [Trifolium pratense]|uniref:Polynucleotidyl transferase, ribonuclease H fold n=1 Tax=Trifolium pratense TaxID=57577 RepID=A0A2K3NNZ0_TRIPR|nr:polynucleotidyl transferase, ribonuclease H fold [Trifolium pratense]